MFSPQSILEKSVLYLCVSFRPKATHVCMGTHTHTCMPSPTANSHRHMLRRTSTCQQIHANPRGHTHTHTHVCTHSWQGPEASPAPNCLKCLLYVILQSPRDSTGWFILRGAAGHQVPLGRRLRTSRQSPEHGLRSRQEEDSWKRMCSAGSQQELEAEGWRGGEGGGESERLEEGFRERDFQTEAERKNPHRGKEKQRQRERDEQREKNRTQIFLKRCFKPSLISAGKMSWDLLKKAVCLPFLLPGGLFLDFSLTGQETLKLQSGDPSLRFPNGFPRTPLAAGASADPAYDMAAARKGLGGAPSHLQDLRGQRGSSGSENPPDALSAGEVGGIHYSTTPIRAQAGGGGVNACPQGPRRGSGNGHKMGRENAGGTRSFRSRAAHQLP